MALGYDTIDQALTGRVLAADGTQPGLQFYLGNFRTGKSPKDTGKGGHLYGRHRALKFFRFKSIV